MMLVIREQQMLQLQHAWREAWIDGLCSHLKGYFPHAVCTFDAAALRRTVEETVTGAAARHGYTSMRDLTRYLNLAAAYGWDFEERPECAWMQTYLHDPDVSCRSARLERLVACCIAEAASEDEFETSWGAHFSADANFPL
jgi:hypothetical protein